MTLKLHIRLAEGHYLQSTEMDAVAGEDLETFLSRANVRIRELSDKRAGLAKAHDKTRP